MPSFDPAASTVRDVRLADIPRLAAELGDRVSRAGYHPEVIVGIESGARLLARQWPGGTRVRRASLAVRRPGSGLKARIAPLLRALPRGVVDRLRRWEADSGRRNDPRRAVGEWAGASPVGCALLLLDDAADSGATLCAARKAAAAAGAREVRAAVLGVTQPGGRAATDWWLWEGEARFPWSPDSPEWREARRLMEEPWL